MKGFTRPEAKVLADNALIPESNLISPAPNQFTHELTRTEPFYYSDAQPDRRPDGELEKGTKVVLLVLKDDKYCRVVDGRGLYVEVTCDSLKRL